MFRYWEALSSPLCALALLTLTHPAPVAAGPENRVGDPDFAQIQRYHDKRIAFMGSGTASVIFPQDFPTTAIFDDMCTRDADNVPVPHAEIGIDGAHRGNLFNPRYRRYLLDWAKIQVDGGVDGVNFDEVLSGFSGGQKYGFNGNEGFDDYTIADFNRYLLAKYPTLTAADFKSRFGLTDDNLLRRDVPAGDLAGNFNYREYPRANGWNTQPLSSANPLVQRGTLRRTLHLVNHNYDRTIVRQSDFTVQADLGFCPRRITVTSPDATGSRPAVFSCAGGTVSVTVDQLDYYSVLALNFD